MLRVQNSHFYFFGGPPLPRPRPVLLARFNGLDLVAANSATRLQTLVVVVAPKHAG
jgi:hypothetical protein